MSTGRSLRLGTRGSALALAQSTAVRDALLSVAKGWAIELAPLVTAGDRTQATGAPLGDKAAWVREIEAALLSEEIDFAVHSAKDVPIDIHPETRVVPVLKRASFADVFISRAALRGETPRRLCDLETSAVLATSSLRRSAQLTRLNRGVQVAAIRGNVPTRLEKVRDSDQFSGLILAMAGLERLSLVQDTFEILSPLQMLPAVNQGILLVQFLAQREEELSAALRALVDEPTRVAWAAERRFIEVLGADCNSAVGVLALPWGEVLRLITRVLSADGQDCLHASAVGSVNAPTALGESLAKTMIDDGAELLLGKA